MILLTASVAIAQPKPSVAQLVGATEITKIAPPAGFIDDAVAGDRERLAYVVAESGSKAELHVLAIATKQEQVADLSAITLHPIALTLVGPRVFVVGLTEDGKQVGALVELGDKKSRTVYKVAPATHITAITRDGKQRIAVDREAAANGTARHDVELLAIENGGRVAARSFELVGNTNKALDFRVNHWSDGFTRAHGIKGGEWDKKEDQRSPDAEATYDVLTGKLDKQKIDDLFEQRKRFQVLADAGGTLDFIHLTADNKALQLWRGGKQRALELDQPLPTYDVHSLQALVAPDAAWLALKVDPVNPDAVARKKADAEYFDIFQVAADGKATRKARVLAAGVRYRFGVAGDRFWLVERNQSMERGGKAITLYAIQ